MTSSGLLQVARDQLGIAEEPPNSNRTKFGEWYGMNGSAWCAMFVSWCAAQSGNVDVIPRFAYCPDGAGWFRGRGQYGSTPTVGAIVFYDTANMGRVSHTGIVEQVLPDGRWYAIEGNTNGAGGRDGGSVRRQLRSSYGTARGGFGRPLYTGQPSTGRPPYGGTLLRRGSSGDAVRAAQGGLNRFLTTIGHQPLVVDGRFGPATQGAVQLFQIARGLDADGVIGPLTWVAIFV